MIIEDRVIFLSITKTAGTTIRRIWEKNHTTYSKHTAIWRSKTYVNIEDRDPLLKNKITDNKGRVDPERIDLKKYYIFTIVRNPYDRLVSLYFYLKQEPKKYRVTNLVTRSIDSITDFKMFIHFFKNNWVKLKYNGTSKPMIDWIRDNNNNILTNKIVKYENLQHDMDDVFQKTGLTYIDFKKDHYNKNDNRKHWMDYFDRETLDIVNELYHEDFKSLDYKIV